MKVVRYLILSIMFETPNSKDWRFFVISPVTLAISNMDVSELQSAGVSLIAYPSLLDSPPTAQAVFVSLRTADLYTLRIGSLQGL